MKLISGEEIICEIVHWPDNKDDDNTMVIRKAAEVAVHEDLEEAVRFYTFRPYMTYIYDAEQFITLNGNNITSITTPHHEMLKQYRLHMKEVIKERTKNLDDIALDSDSHNIVLFKPKYH